MICFHQYHALFFFNYFRQGYFLRSFGTLLLLSVCSSLCIWDFSHFMFCHYFLIFSVVSSWWRSEISRCISSMHCRQEEQERIKINILGVPGRRYRTAIQCSVVFQKAQITKTSYLQLKIRVYFLMIYLFLSSVFRYAERSIYSCYKQLLTSRQRQDFPPKHWYFFITSCNVINYKNFKPDLQRYEKCFSYEGEHVWNRSNSSRIKRGLV
jgi:hypothetical protein